MSDGKPSQKPGAKTTEFWMTQSAVIVNGLVALGVLPQETDLQHASSVFATCLLAGLLGVQYIAGRNGLKGAGETAELARMTRELLGRVGGNLIDRRTTSAEK